MVSLENNLISIPPDKSNLINPLIALADQVDSNHVEQNSNQNQISHSESNTESAEREKVTKCNNENKSEDVPPNLNEENINNENQNIEEINNKKKNLINEEDSKSKTKKVDFFKKNMNKLKEIKEKKDKEAQELEKTRNKMKLNREKLKELVLKRASQIRNIKDEKESKENKEFKEGKDAKEEGIKPFIDTTNQKKLMEKAKMRKYFRSRYATLLNSISENNKIKQEKEVKKNMIKENLKEKLKEELGVSSVKSRVFSLEPKKISENNCENINNSENKSNSKKTSKDNLAQIRTKSQIKPLPPELQNKALKYIAQLSEKKLAKQIKEEKEKKQKDKVFSLDL